MLAKKSKPFTPVNGDLREAKMQEKLGLTYRQNSVLSDTRLGLYHIVAALATDAANASCLQTRLLQYSGTALNDNPFCSGLCIVLF